jgi:hypothetical protein
VRCSHLFSRRPAAELLLLVSALAGCIGQTPASVALAPSPTVIAEAREHEPMLLPPPSPIPSPEELGCRDEAGELTSIEELPRAASLPARAMWLMPANAGYFETDIQLPPLLLEPGAEASRPDPLKFRRTPGELTQLITYNGPELRTCSDRLRDATPPVFETMIDGLVDPRGRTLELAARAVDAEQPMQVAFAECVTELLAKTYSRPRLFRHTPGYTNFEFPIRFTGRPDHHLRPGSGCRPSSSVGLGAAGECRASDPVSADALAISEPLVEFVEENRWQINSTLARTSVRSRERALAAMRVIEGKVPELEACRPGPERTPVESMMLLIDADKRIELAIGSGDVTWECVNAALVGTPLPLAYVGERELLHFMLIWSTPPLGLSAEERLQFHDELPSDYRDQPWPEPIASLLASSRARELCPVELVALRDQIANGFGRVGENAELALLDFAHVLLDAHPAQAHACVTEIADALGPVLTWPAPLEGPALESVGLYEAAARVDTWLPLLARFDAPIALRLELGCFLRRADIELMGTLELRDEAALPSAGSCGLSN